MIYDYIIARSQYTGLRKVEDCNNTLVAQLHTPEAEAVFIAGASALGKSVYDRDAGHGLTGTLDQVLNEGAN
jgi:hypothetical protein